MKRAVTIINEPLYNKVLAITKGFVYPHNSKLYMKKNFNVTKPHYSEQKIYQSLGTSLYRDSTVVVIILLTVL